MSCVFIGITCDALPVVSNGTITSTGRHYNNTAWLQCDPDHRTLYGYTDVWMICQADGTWNVSLEQLSCGGKYSKNPYFIKCQSVLKFRPGTKGLLHGYEWRLRFGALKLRFGYFFIYFLFVLYFCLPKPQ